MQTQEQIENQVAIQNPDIQVIELDEPFKIGSQEITEITVRKPSVPALKKIRIADLLNGDVNAICTVLPLCTSPSLTPQQLNTQVDPVDIVQLGAAVIYFLQPKSVRAELSQQL